MFGVKAWMNARRSGGGTAHLLATWGIAWFVALACTVLIGLEVSRVVAQRSAVMANARLQTANLTRSLLQHAELTFRTADAILIGAVERLEKETLDNNARERLKAWFAREVKNSAQFVAFGVIDEHGTMVVNLRGENAPAQFADREYFLYHRSHADDALRIGRPVRSQSERMAYSGDAPLQQPRRELRRRRAGRDQSASTSRTSTTASNSSTTAPSSWC